MSIQVTWKTDAEREAYRALVRAVASVRAGRDALDRELTVLEARLAEFLAPDVLLDPEALIGRHVSVQVGSILSDQVCNYQGGEKTSFCDLWSGHEYSLDKRYNDHYYQRPRNRTARKWPLVPDTVGQLREATP